MSRRTAIILAAGRGERLRPLTDTTPKPLLTVSGVPLIGHHLRALAAAGVRRVVINLSWLGEQIVRVVGDGREFGVTVVYSDEGPSALETAGGVANALPLLGDDPFWLANGDVFTDFPFRDVELGADDLAHVLLVKNPHHNQRGDFALEGDRAVPRGTAANCPYTYAGIAVVAPALVAGLGIGPAALGPLLFDTARRGRLGASVYAGLWDDIGTVQRLERRRRIEAARQDH